MPSFVSLFLTATLTVGKVASQSSEITGSGACVHFLRSPFCHSSVCSFCQRSHLQARFATFVEM